MLFEILILWLVLAVGTGDASALEPIGVQGKASSKRISQALTPAQLQTLMRYAGYEFRSDENGALEWMLDGYRAYLMIEEDGKSIMFYISFINDGTTPKKINEWNRTKRFSRTYLDQEGNPHLELDLDLDGGVTQARILDFLNTCKISFEAWYRQVVN